jgi:hypothetical protein
MLTIIEAPLFKRDADALWSGDERGGVRVIYFNKPAQHEIWLLVIYAKSVREDIPLHLLPDIREELVDE